MPGSKPDWLKIKVRGGAELTGVEEVLKKLNLNTVCREANCPNRMECFSRKTATFMILGRVCTRNCTFCNVEHGIPEELQAGEPARVAEAVSRLGLRHAVITSVTRDDLPDGGSGQFAQTVLEIKKLRKGVTVEVLIPDFKGSRESLQRVIESRPDIINHNVETVPALYGSVRPQAIYERSLKLLKDVKASAPGIYTKSGIMLGLGEKENEVLQVLGDLREAGCDFLTMGQYLAPSGKHHPVVEYIHPDVFEGFKDAALRMGFTQVASGPFVRSSYMAENMLSP